MAMSPAVAAPEGSTATRTATIRRRLAASIYEALLLSAVALLVGFATLPVIGPPPDTLLPNAPVPLPDQAARLLAFACLFLVWGGYCIGFWTGGRRSLPMKTWSLGLRTSAGAVPDWRNATIRYLACWTGPACTIGLYAILRHHGTTAWSLAPLSLNYAWAIVDRDRQFLQDRIARTRLVVQKTAAPAFTTFPH
jgi:uncharacterized RDD family membrane protein YckC